MKQKQKLHIIVFKNSWFPNFLSLYRTIQYAYSKHIKEEKIFNYIQFFFTLRSSAALFLFYLVLIYAKVWYATFLQKYFQKYSEVFRSIQKYSEVFSTKSKLNNWINRKPISYQTTFISRWKIFSNAKTWTTVNATF